MALRARGLRELAKRILRTPAGRVGELRARFSRRPLGVALAYHRLDSPTRGWDERGMNLAIGADAFADHLSHLRRHYRLVTASELPEAAARRRFGERIPLAITFDDDYPEHLQTAMPMLREAGAPATFFVCGAALERPFSYWWERLERALEARAVDATSLAGMVPPSKDAAGGEPRSVREIVADVEMMPMAEREVLAGELGRLAGPDPPNAGLRAGQLRELADNGFEIGFHTRSHPNLTRLDDAELARALVEGRDEIEAAIGRPMDAISYPGAKWDSRVAAAAREAGWRTGWAGYAKPVAPGDDPHSLGRLNPAWCDTRGQLALALARTLSPRRSAALASQVEEARTIPI